MRMGKFLSLRFRPSAEIPVPETAAATVILIRGDYEADRSCQLVSPGGGRGEDSPMISTHDDVISVVIFLSLVHKEVPIVQSL